MKSITTVFTKTKLGLGCAACIFFLSACSGGGTSSSSSGGAVTGVATPSKVSVVNTN